MGEQARRCVGEDFVHRSIHEAVEWHRTMRRRQRARECIETIYFRATVPSFEYVQPVEAVTKPKRNRAPGPRIRKPNPERDAFRAEAATLREQRLALIVELQRGRCYLCPDKFHRYDYATMDHVVPRIRGGQNLWNILAAHKGCNNRKADRAPYACEMLFLEVVNEQLREPVSNGFVEHAAE